MEVEARHMEIILKVLLAVAATILIVEVEGQTNSLCTVSMINNFTPCFNVITGSSNNNKNNDSDSQKQSCCTSLRSLSGINLDCACLLVTANVPIISLPINAALSLILPTSCNITNLSSAQCKASGSPLPSPGPISLGPTAPSSSAASPLSPQSKGNNLLVVHDNLSLTPTFPPMESQAPATTPHHRIRPVLDPSTSTRPSCFRPPYLLLIFIAIVSGFSN